MNFCKYAYKSRDEIARDAEQMGLPLPMSGSLDALSRRVQIGKKQLPNSLAIHPMEGCDGNADGTPAELTLRRYDRFAAGGAGLLWVEACAVVPEGRANPRQIWLHEGSQSAFDELVNRIHRTAKQRPYTVLQLTHSGRYSRPVAAPVPIIAAENPHLDPYLKGTPEIITDDQLKRLEDDYVAAAKRAAQAGFDAVDIKACHRYLNSELLSGFTRPGEYGGSLENRTRFLLNVIDKVHSALGSSIDVTLRLNLYDSIPYPFGWGVDKDDYQKPDLTEPLWLVDQLSARGIPLINITVANPYYNPHVNRPFDAGPYQPPEHPLAGCSRILSMAREVQKCAPQMKVMGTGFSWLREHGAHVAAGCLEEGWFSIAGFGRQAFAYPDFATDALAGGMNPKKCCIACGKCSEIMRDGGMAGCVIRDSSTYAPIYRAGREGKPPIQSDRPGEHV